MAKVVYHDQRESGSERLFLLLLLRRTDFIRKKVCPKEGTRVRIPGVYHITTWYGAVGH